MNASRAPGSPSRRPAGKNALNQLPAATVEISATHDVAAMAWYPSTRWNRLPWNSIPPYRSRPGSTSTLGESLAGPMLAGPMLADPALADLVEVSPGSGCSCVIQRSVTLKWSTLKLVSLQRITTSTLSPRLSAATLIPTEPPGVTTIGRRNSTSSSTSRPASPVSPGQSPAVASTEAACVIASIPNTAGNNSSPSSAWSARYRSLSVDNSASATSSMPG